MHGITYICKQPKPFLRMKRLLLLAMLLLSPALVLAAEPAAAPLPKPKIPFQKQHEVRLSAGAWPTITDISQPYFINNIDRTRIYESPTYATGAFTLSYDFRFMKWFDLGLAVSYYGEFNTAYSNIDRSKLGNQAMQFISVMPVVRFTWLNRPLVRMYSSLGLGMLVKTGNSFSGLHQYNFRETEWSAQFSPFGIAVGRALFGYVEVGIGMHGTLIAGIGYRFNSQKAPKQ